MLITSRIILHTAYFLILTCHRRVSISYNMALTTLAGKARNEGSEIKMYKRANHSTAFLQHTCDLGEIPFQT